MQYLCLTPSATCLIYLLSNQVCLKPLMQIYLTIQRVFLISSKPSPLLVILVETTLISEITAAEVMKFGLAMLQVTSLSSYIIHLFDAL